MSLFTFAGVLESEKNSDRSRSSIHGFTNMEYKRKTFLGFDLHVASCSGILGVSSKY